MKIIKYVLIFSLILIIPAMYLYYRYSKIPNLNSNNSIVILGKGGMGHTAPDLTDTIMLLNFNIKQHKISLLSLPRDIWINSTKAKLNSSYYWGKKNGKDYSLVSDSISEVTGIRPKNTVVVDFSLFKDLIDTLGGIDVYVENSFVDEKYPISGKENDLCGGDLNYGCRYEKLEFFSGKTHMDGDLALKFVRSRNSIGDEGTDLAREKRQQKIVSAVKDKFLSINLLLNPIKLKSLFDLGVSHVETDIDLYLALSYFKEFLNSKANVFYISIPEEFLVVSQGDKKYDKQYVFLPKSGDWNSFQLWIASII